MGPLQSTKHLSASCWPWLSAHTTPQNQGTVSLSAKGSTQLQGACRKGSREETYEVSPIYLAAFQLCQLELLFPANISHCGMPAIFYKVNNFFLIG